jgi:hypothetical protein
MEKARFVQTGFARKLKISKANVQTEGNACFVAYHSAFDFLRANTCLIFITRGYGVWGG